MQSELKDVISLELILGVYDLYSLTLEVEACGFLGMWDQPSQHTALHNSQSNIIIIICLNIKQRIRLDLFADSIIIYSRVIRYKMNIQKSIIFLNT